MNKKILIVILVVGLILLSGFVLWSMEKKQKPTAVPQELRQETQKRLSEVKVASLYENITDGVLIGRSLDETIKLLKETKTDFIFRGFWKWMPVVESPDEIPQELLELAEDKNLIPSQVSESLRKGGHYYKNLKESISAIKKEIPDIIFVGAVPAQTLGRVEWNPITGRIYKTEDTWKMALDPQKWNIKRNGKPVTKEEFQAWFYGIHPYGGKLEQDYDWRKALAYFPDITNPDFQELLLSWAKRQIDCGADAIWIDMLYNQAKLLVQITRDTGHPAVKESFATTKKIVDEIHKYGELKGKYIYVGSWVSRLAIELGLPYSTGDVDFITITPSNEEVLNKRLDEEKWNQAIRKIRKFYSDIPVFAFIDWAFDESQTVIFSQKLSKEEQREVLETFDESFAKMGVNFVYPVHGGYMGRGEITQKLAFGKLRIYDSLAPEFQTYETIKELALAKAGEEAECGNGICKSGECDSCLDCEPEHALPSGLSPEYEQEYIDRSKWLDEKLIEWEPIEYKPMHFMGFLLSLSGPERDYTTLEDDLKILDMLVESGADIISVGIMDAPGDLDESLLDRYDRVFTEIRNKNLKLKIWVRTFMYSPAQKPQKALSSTQYIMKRWNPEYLVITHEPKCSSPAAMESLKQWVGKCCQLAKSINPNVATSVTVINYKNRLDCVDYFVEIPELDIIGFDIYGLWGLCEDCPGGNAVEDAIKKIHSKGKESWIEELWLSTQWDKSTPDPTDICPGFNDPHRAWWDSRFMKVMTYYAQKNNLIGIEPWFTSHFFLYPGYDNLWRFEGKEQIPIPTEQYLEDIRNAFAQGRRTPAFCAFKDVIEEVRNKTGR